MSSSASPTHIMAAMKQIFFDCGNGKDSLDVGQLLQTLYTLHKQQIQQHKDNGPSWEGSFLTYFTQSLQTEMNNNNNITATSNQTDQNGNISDNQTPVLIDFDTFTRHAYNTLMQLEQHSESQAQQAQHDPSLSPRSSFNMSFITSSDLDVIFTALSDPNTHTITLESLHAAIKSKPQTIQKWPYIVEHVQHVLHELSLTAEPSTSSSQSVSLLSLTPQRFISILEPYIPSLQNGPS